MDTNIKKLAKHVLISLFVVSTVACSDSGSSSKNDVSINNYHNPLECTQQKVPVGIHGNTACPYQGEYDPDYGLQGYSIQFSGSIGVGFYIDFGWEYNDMCPQDGQLPVFQNGSFSHCSDVNPNFAGPYHGHTNRSMAECAGDQFNPDITGCRPKLQPTVH